MASPFPGMDPYLEAPYIWPDFHEAFAAEIRNLLNAVLPAPYYARLEMRPEIGIVENGGTLRKIVPDVAVAKSPKESGGVALVEPVPKISRSLEVKLLGEPIKHSFVEIRDPNQGHHLITLIEIASPSNKRPGPDRQAYLKKQQEVLGSDANLIELDLLRTGERLFAQPELETMAGQIKPVPDYLVLVNRGWNRLAYQIFPVLLEEPLPCITVPLQENQPEVPLDLQFVMNRAYDGGPYRRGAVDYTKAPDPPLGQPKNSWLEQCLSGITR